MNEELLNLEKEVKDLTTKIDLLKTEIGKIIIGQEETIEQLLITFLAGGHALLEGVPGLAKTLMIRTLSDAIALKFKRIQFTPDLMPSDIIGTEILEEDHTTGKKFFEFNKGPIFSNIILADEINRTPPKTQAALLEAMQEFEVTYSGKTYKLDKPFFILATQNPIEQSGTFPLPEAQQDRFLLYIKIGYPSEQEETSILKSTTSSVKKKVNPVISGEEILRLQELVRELPISDDLIGYVSKIVRATRPETTTIDFVKEWVSWGAGPRAGQAMILTAKARALSQKRLAVTKEDINVVAYPVLRHRVIVNFKAEAARITSDHVTKDLLKNIAF
ncbi:MAG: MoxR family ATPase [Zunongwangia sp.]|uniref:MoxR protein n=2 Tax=Zunongwangia profunda TaxID=398743 RepID=D5B9X4_ZUNPS|nr:MoxR family ATPase [Zunongwangia profunda]MAG87951.1 MoxR family ATPase [Flavobacteriaceae bacterium]MAO37296.1 MoxR family ATPase [Zunongwangia sp.]ADF52272.1 moxR protein [Zunongwangia profunda SM-A87]MAS71033.1 MoxR family ATPase [Zunongwangia sp.]HAJ81845.1 MoxR family ATPase [Zunongwangia profunda]|tara:strand:+ start:5428 stop:6423 length:996 start_codon:yes stop_codon:yes gene_type:complete